MAKKSGLGRGLGLLVGEADAETAGMRPDSTLPISEIKPNKGQPRKTFRPEELAELADSIKQNGILQPLLVRKKGPDTRSLRENDGIRLPRQLVCLKFPLSSARSRTMRSLSSRSSRTSSALT